MLKLYYSPDTYSRAAQIILHETGLAFTLIEVDLSHQALPDGTDFYDINPKGYVPLLELQGGERISELSVILTYLADQAPHLKLAPPHGTLERIRLLETLNFIATEMHKANSFLLNPRIDAAAVAYYRQWLRGPYEWLDEQLAKSEWIMGSCFTIVDAYAFVAVGQAISLAINLDDLLGVQAFRKKMQGRASVQATEDLADY
ncbi:glutathione S-transferase N-terminal domain-containing protein [Pseudomonas capsici]|uniref:glutathione S-transferase N-terminal domain-containing protein n=1 Tax=Pseudomonas capsici TaxID=2810614 RepID=UPI0021F0FF99|nr:glutathione S-transferase N-terminal domain-containing protein [Pseudomonas capsici]MCV4276072.1 glutathione S-transferase N-terminal domain-containing protein [Pseudomonas capsici]